MKSSLPILTVVLTALIAASPGSARAQTTEPVALTDEQRTSIRERLTGIVTNVKEVTESRNSNLTSIFMNAAASERAAVEFFEECVKKAEFEDQGYSESDFRRWKSQDGVKRMLSDKDFAESLQIILRYLAVSIEAERTSDKSTIFPALTKYIDGVASLDELPSPGGGRGGGGNFAPGLNTPIYDTVFARAFEIFEDLKKNDRKDQDMEEETGDEKATKQAKWESRPLNIGGMYAKFIIPYLQENSPDKVLAAWSKRIQQEARLATARGEEDEYVFRTKKMPVLQWDMYIDQFKAGYEVSSAAKMLEHLENHKATHADANDWVQEMIKLVFPETDSTYKEKTEPEPVEKKPNPLEGIKLGE